MIIAVRQTEASLSLRKLLAANIKDRRKKLEISQEKLAELADVSVQTVNFIEGCRTWVSDKTLAKLAEALHVEAYRLLLPEVSPEPEKLVPVHKIQDLRRGILNDIDKRFEELIEIG
ncbi:MAG: helix-turn-helix domain-containing protein [Spirochaetaceae bacterium]|jgi:transcriptional regulator with XRE-family HTH domain|nr:helix-turn-helix domain-containing protein [Spirochaetaceae bacterium]